MQLLAGGGELDSAAGGGAKIACGNLSEHMT
jgi:hypothetical protein